MNSILVAPTRRALEGRVLAIEPDPSYVRRLKTLLQEQVTALEITASADLAIASIDRRVPDLVMTSAFLDPAETRKLTDHLKSLPSAAHVQMIITPHLIEHEIAPPSSWALSRRRLRARETRPYCDPEAFLRQVDEYLTQARTAREEEAPQEPSPIVVDRPEIRLVTPAAASEPDQPSIILSANTLADASDRRRATRQRRDQLPWLRGARLPWGNDLNIVDVSRTGVLAETTSRVSPGTTVDLQFLAEDSKVTVPSRVLRTYVAQVDRLGVKYRVAAAFNRDLDLIENIEDELVAPKALGEVLARTLADADHLADPDVLRDRFEREVRRLVPVRSVRIRHSPVMCNDGDDSVYFKVPAGSGSAVLQTTFERGRPPSPMEFKVLKAAANLAAVLLEFAPLDTGRQLRALA